MSDKSKSWAGTALPPEPDTEPDAKAPEPKPAKAKASAFDEFCYVLHAADANEEKDAQKWRDALLQREPNATPKLVTEIKMARLSERHSVVALYRKDGATELQATEPVLVRAHWRKEGDDGSVNDRTFIRELARRCLPAMLKLRRDTDEDLGILKLGYA